MAATETALLLIALTLVVLAVLTVASIRLLESTLHGEEEEGEGNGSDHGGHAA
jgi:hypothetical protein